MLTASRGPEIESWFGAEDGHDPATDNDWSFLPFMSLSDGAHGQGIPGYLLYAIDADHDPGPPKTSLTSPFSAGRLLVTPPPPSSVYHVRGRWMPMSC